MIDKILELSLRQRAFILLAALALVAVGLWSASRLSIDAVPDITGVQVQINTEVSALAAEESERFVTWPIEIEMAGLPGLEEMRSLTKFGFCHTTSRRGSHRSAPVWGKFFTTASLTNRRRKSRS
ncbi:MAG: hypothetical protein DME30_08810 [Verrucomicrobia bacterium]|nr:MAG: hypothetical protein DME30_08810 [Verrucomicrobiota bacterium]